MSDAPMSEHRLQVKLINFLRENARPDVFYFAVPNGGLRNFRVAQRMKAEGLYPGIADLCFMLSGGLSAWLEMKTPTGSLGDHQLGFKTRCEALGHKWAMARSLDEAIEVLTKWGVLR